MSEIRAAWIGGIAALVGVGLGSGLTWLTNWEAARTSYRYEARGRLAEHSIRLRLALDEYRELAEWNETKPFTENRWKELRKHAVATDQGEPDGTDRLTRAIHAYLQAVAGAPMNIEEYHYARLSRNCTLVRRRILDSSNQGIYNPKEGESIYTMLKNIGDDVDYFDGEAGIPVLNP